MKRVEFFKFLASLKEMRASATDAQASKAVYFFPDMKYDNSLISVGTLINWNGVCKRAAVDLWDTESNNPDNAPTLWVDITYREGYRIIPEIITVTTAFKLNEIGWWNDNLYKSLIDSNVYTPDQYPSGWEIIE